MNMLSKLENVTENIEILFSFWNVLDWSLKIRTAVFFKQALGLPRLLPPTNRRPALDFFPYIKIWWFLHMLLFFLLSVVFGQAGTMHFIYLGRSISIIFLMYVLRSSFIISATEAGLANIDTFYIRTAPYWCPKDFGNWKTNIFVPKIDLKNWVISEVGLGGRATTYFECGPDRKQGWMQSQNAKNNDFTNIFLWLENIL